VGKEGIDQGRGARKVWREEGKGQDRDKLIQLLWDINAPD
jgi:hypothetical protein